MRSSAIKIPAYQAGWMAGYLCDVYLYNVLLHGCNCPRSTTTDIKRVFRPHVARDGGQFPVHYTVQDAWLRDIKMHGFDIPDLERPGFLIGPPTTVSYGFLAPRPLLDASLSLSVMMICDDEVPSTCAQ